MKYKLILAALACVVLALSLVGCGAFKGQTNDLKSIQISTSNASEAPPGTLNLPGEGATVQLYTWGNYANGLPKLVNDTAVSYQISIAPDSVATAGTMGDPNADPPQTVQLSSPAGLITAITPWACTWVDGDGKGGSWFLSGSYQVTATYKGLVSSPVYVGVGSAAVDKFGCGPVPKS